MSSNSTGTRKERTVQTRASDAIIENDKSFISNLRVFSEVSSPVSGSAGGAVGSTPNLPTGNFLARQGDSMIGPLALDPPITFTAVVDSNNTIDIGPSIENPQYSSNILLDDLQPNSSTLDIIANATFDGQVLIIRTFAPTVAYTIRQGTVPNGGNIQTGDSNDITVGNLQTVLLIYDDNLILNGGTWRVVSVSSGGGGTGIAFPIDFPEEVVRTSLSATETINFANSTRHSIAMIVDIPSVAIDFSNEPANELALCSITIQQDGSGGRAITFVDTVNNSQTIIDAFAALSANESISFMIEWERAVFTAYLKTGNIVSGGSGGGLNTDLSNMVSPTIPPVALSMNSKDILLVDRLEFVQNSGALSSVIQPTIYLDGIGAGDLVINNNTAEAIVLTHSNVIGAQFIANEVQFQSTNTLERLRIFRSGTNPTVNTTFGDIIFNANRTTSGKTDYAIISGVAEDVGDSTFEGGMAFQVNKFSGSEIFMRFNDLKNNLVDIFKDLDMNTNDVLAGGAGQGMLNTGHIDFIDNLATPVATISLYSDGTDLFANTGGGVVNLTDIGTTAGGANVFLSNLSTPTSINRDLIPQANLTLGTNGDPWEEVYAEEVTMPVGGTFISTRNMIISDAGGMRFNTPTLNEYDWAFANAAPVWAMSATVFSGPSIILSGSLAITDSATDPLANGQFTVDGTAVKVMTGGVVKNLNDIGTGVFLPLSGGTMSGAINMGNNDVDNVDDIHFNAANNEITQGGGIMSIRVDLGETLRLRVGTTTLLNLTTDIAFINANTGFFGATPVAQQTSVAVTAAAIHAALVNLGLITA